MRGRPPARRRGHRLGRRAPAAARSSAVPGRPSRSGSASRGVRHRHRPAIAANPHEPIGGGVAVHLTDRCRLSSVGQSDALVMRRSTVRFRQAAQDKRPDQQKCRSGRYVYLCSFESPPETPRKPCADDQIRQGSVVDGSIPSGGLQTSAPTSRGADQGVRFIDVDLSCPPKTPRKRLIAIRFDLAVCLVGRCAVVVAQLGSEGWEAYALDRTPMPGGAAVTHFLKRRRV